MDSSSGWILTVNSSNGILTANRDSCILLRVRCGPHQTTLANKLLETPLKVTTEQLDRFLIGGALVTSPSSEWKVNNLFLKEGVASESIKIATATPLPLSAAFPSSFYSTALPLETPEGQTTEDSEQPGMP